MNMHKLKTQTPIAAALLAVSTVVCAEEPLRGLWVGQATLTHVNEVTIPLDVNNDPIAPNPGVPTLTADAAHLRLILHVDGMGQVSLLKDVAILRRVAEGEEEGLFDSEGDLALVSDERLYSEFPAQEARRIASAVFDFGDYRATEAVNALVDEIVEQVAQNVSTSGIDGSSSTAQIRIAEDEAQLAAENGVASSDLISSADAAAEFDQFMITHLDSVLVDAIAVGGAVPASVSDAAVALAGTFYGDTRGLAVIDAILNVSTNAQYMTDDERKAAARFVASRYYDTDNLYQRFITGSDFGDMIPAAAREAAASAVASNATPESITNAVYALSAVRLTESNAPPAQISRYSDTAALDAVYGVLDVIIDAASSSTNPVAEVIAAEAETAGRRAQARLPRFALPVLTPTADYTTFVRSDVFLECVPGAAEAAAVAAVAEKKSDPFSTEASVAGAARIAAVQHLKSVYIQAAKARRTELPMAGTFGPGEGDPRLTGDAGVGSLGTPGLACEINLPASHPTNPFRHAKHPDHTVGIDITRKIRVDFDAGVPSRSPTGVDRVTGIYREEVFGLHKPLGPESNTGLKVEGTFELNRVSLIDTLNSL